MYSVAPITVDGIPVGVVIFGYEDAVPVDAMAPADDPLSIPGSSASGSLGGDGSAPAHYDASVPATGKTEPKVTPHTGRSGDIHTGTYGPGRPHESVNTAPHVVETDSPHDVQQHHTVTDTPHETPEPPRDAEAPHAKPKHITTDDIKALGEHPADDHRQPEFRPGRIPLGKDRAVAPPKFSVDDVQKAVKGHDTEKLPHYTTDDVKNASIVGGIDRSRFKEELEKHPELYKKMAWMVRGEVMGRATKEARMAQLETAFNRATKRGQSLQHVLLSVSESKQGYYAGHGAPGGGTYAPSKEPTPEEVEQFKRDIVAPVMAGSNYARGMSGNASSTVAAHQIAKGTPHYNMNAQGGDILFDEDAHRGPLPRLPGAGAESIEGSKKPVGVTRLGPEHPAGVGRFGPAVAKGASGVPSHILEKAEDVAKSGGAPAVFDFMRKHGYPRNGNWCGEFAAAVVKASGGTPPSGAAVASNWRKWGSPVEGTPQPGDIAIRRGPATGHTGSHVTIVESADPKTGKFTGLGGDQGGHWRVNQSLGAYDFRRGEKEKD